MSNQTFVIVGAGQAAAQAVDSLRCEGFDGRLLVVGDECHPPYQRPPLSKQVLSGTMPAGRALHRPLAFYEQARAELKLGVRADSIDLAHHSLVLSDGELLRYDRLLLATGAIPRRLNVPGHNLRGVHYFRTLDDVERIRAEVACATRIVIIGAGYLGLEVAATCRALGLEVDVIEMADRVMNRVVSPEVSAFFMAAHQSAGVRIHTQTAISGIEARPDDSGRVSVVHAVDGRTFPADVVVVGIGVIPSTELAAAAGLACDNGIAVDEHCRTNDECVYAAGDCASRPSQRYNRRVRLESVDNAVEQAKSAAASMIGKLTIHDPVPWFWSEQFDLKLLTAGLSIGYDHVVLRGDTSTRAFSCCYLYDRELVAIDCVNRPKDYVASRKLIAWRRHFNIAKLADPSVAMIDAVVEERLTGAATTG